MTQTHRQQVGPRTIVLAVVVVVVLVAMNAAPTLWPEAAWAPGLRVAAYALDALLGLGLLIGFFVDASAASRTGRKDLPRIE
jgi:sterol desaturase/sphingolipid hydroxylase (fatty acid hydroxylase superfamily)